MKDNTVTCAECAYAEEFRRLGRTIIWRCNRTKAMHEGSPQLHACPKFVFGENPIVWEPPTKSAETRADRDARVQREIDEANSLLAGILKNLEDSVQNAAKAVFERKGHVTSPLILDELCPGTHSSAMFKTFRSGFPIARITPILRRAGWQKISPPTETGQYPKYAPASEAPAAAAAITAAITAAKAAPAAAEVSDEDRIEKIRRVLDAAEAALADTSRGYITLDDISAAVPDCQRRSAAQILRRNGWRSEVHEGRPAIDDPTRYYKCEAAPGADERERQTRPAHCAPEHSIPAEIPAEVPEVPKAPEVPAEPETSEGPGSHAVPETAEPELIRTVPEFIYDAAYQRWKGHIRRDLWAKLHRDASGSDIALTALVNMAVEEHYLRREGKI